MKGLWMLQSGDKAAYGGGEIGKLCAGVHCGLLKIKCVVVAIIFRFLAGHLHISTATSIFRQVVTGAALQTYNSLDQYKIHLH
jgi:hypothetical protein